MITTVHHVPTPQLNPTVDNDYRIAEQEALDTINGLGYETSDYYHGCFAEKDGLTFTGADWQQVLYRIRAGKSLPV